MPADIVECTYLIARTAGDDDVQPDLFEQLIGPVIWDFADVTRMEPGLAPEMLHLQVVHPLVGIARGRYFGKRRKAFRIARAVQFVADRLIDRVVKLRGHIALLPIVLLSAPPPPLRSGRISGIRPRKRPFPHYAGACRSEEHTSELQSLMRISYAVFCLNK